MGLVDKIQQRKVAIIYICSFILACCFVVHTGLDDNSSYIDLNKWLDGKERLPFQKRSLLIPVLRYMESLHVIQKIATTGHNLFKNPVTASLVFIDFASLLGCGVMVTWLYNRTTLTSRMRWAPSALMLVLYVFTAAFRWEQRFIFPYDMLSMFFFTLGICLIVSNKIWALFLLMPLATKNRETTLMWAPMIFMAGRYRAQFAGNPRAAWIKTIVCTIGMIAMWALLMHWIDIPYAHNDKSEDYPRMVDNLKNLIDIRVWDQFFSLFAFSLPFVLIFRSKVDSGLMRSMLPIVPIWIGVMFYQGVFIEGRIFSELIPFYSVICVLIFEHVYLLNPQLAFESVERRKYKEQSASLAILTGRH